MSNLEERFQWHGAVLLRITFSLQRTLSISLFCLYKICSLNSLLDKRCAIVFQVTECLASMLIAEISRDTEFITMMINILMLKAFKFTYLHNCRLINLIMGFWYTGFEHYCIRSKSIRWWFNLG